MQCMNAPGERNVYNFCSAYNAYNVYNVYDVVILDNVCTDASCTLTTLLASKLYTMYPRCIHCVCINCGQCIILHGKYVQMGYEYMQVGSI